MVLFYLLFVVCSSTLLLEYFISPLINFFLFISGGIFILPLISSVFFLMCEGVGSLVFLIDYLVYYQFNNKLNNFSITSLYYYDVSLYSLLIILYILTVLLLIVGKVV